MTINFPFGTNGKLMIVGVPILLKVLYGLIQIHYFHWSLAVFPGIPIILVMVT